jgi:hypothetical protein
VKNFQQLPLYFLSRSLEGMFASFPFLPHNQFHQNLAGGPASQQKYGGVSCLTRLHHLIVTLGTKWRWVGKCGSNVWQNSCNNFTGIQCDPRFKFAIMMMRYWMIKYTIKDGLGNVDQMSDKTAATTLLVFNATLDSSLQ